MCGRLKYSSWGSGLGSRNESGGIRDFAHGNCENCMIHPPWGNDDGGEKKKAFRLNEEQFITGADLMFDV